MGRRWVIRGVVAGVFLLGVGGWMASYGYWANMSGTWGVRQVSCHVSAGEVAAGRAFPVEGV